MGWDVPHMYIERGSRNTSGESDYWYLMACPWNIFAFLEVSKSFLLGHAKYGPQPGWEPARDLRGLPGTTSDEVRRLIEGACHEVGDATWLTLPELESIDLSKPLGLPNDVEAVLRYPTQYFRFELHTTEGYEYLSGSQLDKSVIRSAFEDETRIEQADRTIHVEQIKRDHYANGFKQMLEFMRDISEGDSYDTYSIPAEQIRLLIWSDGERSTDSAGDYSESFLEFLYRRVRGG